MATILGSATAEALTGTDEDDTIVAAAGGDTVNGGGGSDTYLVGRHEGFDVYRDSGASGTDVIAASGHDVAIGLGPDFDAGSGIEEITAAGHLGVTVRGDDVDNRLDFSRVRLTGVERIETGAGADTLVGSAGDDVLAAGAGADRLNGGAGSDTYLVGRHQGFDLYEDLGGSGTDSILATTDAMAIGVASGFGPASGIEVISAAGHLDVVLRGDDVDNRLDFSATRLDGVAAIETGAGRDTVIASTGDDVVRTGGGEDLIVGGKGADTLDGGSGGDTYQVGRHQGYDLYQDSGSGGVDRIVATDHDMAIGLGRVFGPGSGIEEIDVAGHLGVVLRGDDVDNNLDLAGVRLIGIDRIETGAGQDTIVGSAGEDVISAGAGSDQLDGGEAGDTFLVGRHQGFDRYLDTGAAGEDRIVATSAEMAIGVGPSFSAASGIEVVSSGDHAGVVVRGDDIDNALDFSGVRLDGIVAIETGAGADTVTGSSGDDLLRTGAGDDVLRGGAGADRLEGGLGADRFDFGSVADGGDTILDFRQGQDLISLQRVDADTTTEGDQGFLFVAGPTSGGVAHAITWEHVGGQTVISADVDGDGQGDFTLTLSSLVNLTSGDFLL